MSRHAKLCRGSAAFAAPYVLALVACSRGAAPAPERESTRPEQPARNAAAPEPAAPAEPEPSTAVDAGVAPSDARSPMTTPTSVVARQCWSFADDAGRAHEVCITMVDAGRPLDEMTTSESGRIVATREGTVIADRTYTSVQEDGAAGSIYSTYRTAAGEPALVIRRTGDCPDKCVREARIPTARGEITVMRECDVSCSD